MITKRPAVDRTLRVCDDIAQDDNAHTIPQSELSHPSRDAGTIYLLASGGYGASYPPFLRPYRHNRHRAGGRSATGACGAFGPWLLTGLMLKVFRLPVSSLRTLSVHIGSKDRYGKRSACRWPRHVIESAKGKRACRSASMAVTKR